MYAVNLTMSSTQNARLGHSFAALLLFLVLPQGIATAGDDLTGSESSAERELLVRDLRLTLTARQSLQQDKDLALCNIGVSVRQGVAVLWGRVPSEVLAERARQRLRQVPGLIEVHSELFITPADSPPAKGPIQPIVVRSHPCEKPAMTGEQLIHRSDRPDLVPQPLPAWAGLETRFAPSGADNLMPPMALPKLAAASGPSDAVVVTPPIALPKVAASNQAVSQRVPTDLADEIDRLRKASDRFLWIEFSVDGGMVDLRGVVQRGEDLMELVQAISRLPGVERVLVAGVRIAR